MTIIPWNPGLEIGHAEIDRQHRGLVATLNRLYDMAMIGRGREELIVLVEEFERQTEQHFASEERLMDEIAYEQREAHRQEHRSMLDEIHRYCDDCVLGHGDPRALITYFQASFVRHLGAADRDFGATLAASGG